MPIVIKIQHLGSEKEIEISTAESLDNLKIAIEKAYFIPAEEQALFLEERNLGNSSKQLEELGLKEGSVVIVKKIKKVEGKSKKNGMMSFMKNPMVKNILNDPKAISSMGDLFPDLKKEIEENSSLNMLMNNGEIGEEFEKFANDEDYANLQLRNNDILLAKLANTPDGIRLVNGINKDTQNLSGFQIPQAELKGGQNITEKTSNALPGKCKKNSLILYRKELVFLRQIGYENQIDNIEALNAVDGDVQLATEMLAAKYATKN